MSDLVGKSEDGLSRIAAQIVLQLNRSTHRLNFVPFSDTALNRSEENIFQLSRKSSTSSGSSSNTGMSNHLSASNPDLSTTGLIIDDKPNDFPEHVVKVFRADQSFKYLLIHKVRIIRLLDDITKTCPCNKQRFFML